MIELETKNYILKTLQDILNIDSPTGYCHNVISYLERQVSEMGFTYTKNNKGNLIISIDNNSDYTIGFGAHVDTLGAMVRSINSNGTLKFTCLGSPTLPTIDGEYCRIITRSGQIYTGTFLSDAFSSHVHENAKTEPRNEKTMHIRIDEKISCKEDVLKLGINSGDFIAIDPKTEITNKGFIKSRFLDDKLSVAVLFGLLRSISTKKICPKNNLKFIISTYEEVGHGSSCIPKMDEFIAVDMGCIGLDLNCTEYDVSICCKDSSGPYDFDITTKLINLAKENNLNYAVDIYPQYGSDVSAALKGGNNIKGGLIGPGVAASHGMERSHIDGLVNTFELLSLYIK